VAPAGSVAGHRQRDGRMGRDELQEEFLTSRKKNQVTPVFRTIILPNENESDIQ
jgi:hypothetical protein